METKSYIFSEDDLEIMNQMVAEATQNAVKIIKKNELEERKKKVDTRLNNTYLLLKNYNLFKMHAEEANYRDYECTLNELEDVANSITDDKEQYFVQSILRTKKRTKIMLQHIDNCLYLYKIKCQASEKEDVQRRYKIINLLFIEQSDKNENYTTEQVAEILYISTGTVSATKKIALKELSILLFGIDALKFD